MLFKYYAPTRHAIDNLINRKIFCSHYGHFNDPFEFRAIIQSGIPSPEAEPERYATAAATWGFPDWAPGTELDDAEEYFSSLGIEPPFKAMFDDARIACFAEDDANLLMWSHYADGLRGFCLIFDEEALTQVDSSAYFTSVEYFDAPPTVDSFVYAVANDQFEFHRDAIHEGDALERRTGKSDPWRADYVTSADDAMDTMHSIWRRVFAAKPRQWEYEREKRLIFMVDVEDELPFELVYPPSALKGVIVGERMAPTYCDELVAVVAAKYEDVPISVAVRKPDKYSVEILPFADR